MKPTIFKLTAIIITTAIITLASCKKDDDNNNPNPEPGVTLNITSPKASDMYGLGDTVWMRTNASWTNQFHGCEVRIRNISDGNKEVFKAEWHMHGTTASVDTFWINNVSNHSNMELEVDMIKDHDGNKETKKVTFHCHPM